MLSGVFETALCPPDIFCFGSGGLQELLADVDYRDLTPAAANASDMDRPMPRPSPVFRTAFPSSMRLVIRRFTEIYEVIYLTRPRRLV